MISEPTVEQEKFHFSALPSLVMNKNDFEWSSPLNFTAIPVFEFEFRCHHRVEKGY